MLDSGLYNIDKTIKKDHLKNVLLMNCFPADLVALMNRTERHIGTHQKERTGEKSSETKILFQNLKDVETRLHIMARNFRSQQ